MVDPASDVAPPTPINPSPIEPHQTSPYPTDLNSVGDDGLRAILRGCTGSLKSLNLNGCKGFTGAALCPQSWPVNVRGVMGGGGEGQMRLLTTLRLSYLKRLDLGQLTAGAYEINEFHPNSTIRYPTATSTSTSTSTSTTIST